MGEYRQEIVQKKELNFKQMAVTVRRKREKCLKGSARLLENKTLCTFSTVVLPEANASSKMYPIIIVRTITYRVP